MSQTISFSSGGSPRRNPDQNENRRYWTDEEEDNAVYNVFLKKIRFRQGGVGQVHVTDIASGVSYLEWQTVKVRVLKAGTLDKILQCLINEDDELDSSHVNIFLDTYREFARPDEVIELLLSHLAGAYGTKRERPLRQLMMTLLENYPEDFSLAARVELDESVMLMLEHVEKYQDIEFKNKLIQRIAQMNASPFSQQLEVLDWIQDLPQCELTSDYATAEDLLNYGDKFIAEQLTLVDAVFLRQLLPHQCLAQERAKATSRKLMDTVQTTICHFNAVCARVESSLLGDLGMSNSLRLRLLIKWIDVAQFLLVLKNFSSLNAVVSALQAEPVFRLEKLWASLPADKMMRFKELAGIFSSDWNGTRNDLLQGATLCAQSYSACTKEPTTLKIAKKTGHRRSYSDNPGNIYGMVPYLGKFLTDLVMLDTALPDSVTSSSGQRLLNFDKRRKEFEILAQIRLFQSAAASYQIIPHDHFRFWFYKTLRVLDGEDCFNNSFLIEPPVSVTRSISEISDSSEGGRSKRSALRAGLSTLKRMVSQENLLAAPLMVTRKNSISSSQSLDYRRATSANENSCAKSPYLSDTFCILKIGLDGNCGTSTFYGGVNLYKSILVNDCEKTLAVIRAALEKHDMGSDDPTNYDLVQVLSQNEVFVIPPEATVFYAINSSEGDLRFILRKKAMTQKFVHSTLPKSASMSRYRNPKDTLKKWSIKHITTRI